MPRLGETLVAMGACDADRVREALESQVIFGGRLGTNLLDLGAVDEETLARALSRQHGRPALCGDIAIDPRLAALLKPERADRFEVVPYELTGHKLSVLCCDPADLAKLDEVAFATGKEIVPVIVPEARLWALLRAHYGVARPMRGLALDYTRQRRAAPAQAGPAAGPDLMDEAEFAALYGDRAGTGAAAPGADSSRSRARAPGQDELQPPRPPSLIPPPLPSRRRPPPTPPARPAGTAAGDPVSSGEVLAQAEASAREARGHVDALGGASAPPPAPLSFGEAAAALAGVADRGAIARVVLRYARSRFQRAVLFTVHARGVDGWEGIGDGLSPQTVARVHVPLGQPGVVQTVVESRAHFLGPLARTEANIRMLRALAGGAPRNVFAMPILARGKVVNVLYADDGRGGLVNPDGVGELLILASRISQTYDELLQRAK